MVLASRKGSSKAKHSAHAKGKHSKKAQRVGSHRQVFSGKRVETKGHLKRGDLVTNARGKVVSRKKHEAGKRLYATNEAFQKNAMAVKKARKSLVSKGNRSPSFEEIRKEANKIKDAL
jgi:DVNP family